MVTDPTTSSSDDDGADGVGHIHAAIAADPGERRSMETRKLQQVGGGTYTVSIPKPWAEARGLEAGNRVRLYTHVDGSIVVEHAEDDPLGRIRPEIAVVGSTPAHATRALEAAYAVGFDAVTLVPRDTFTDAQRRAVRQAVKTLAGTTIVAERPDGIAVKNLLDATDVSIDQSLRQLRYVAGSVHRRGMTAVLAADPATPAPLADRTEDTERLGRMVERYWQRCLVSLSTVDRLGTEHPALFDGYETARQLENVAAQGVAIAGVAGRLDAPLPDPITSDLNRLAGTVRTLVDVATGAVLASDRDRANAVLDRRPAVAAAFEGLESPLYEDGTGRGDVCLSPRARVAATRVLDELRSTAAVGFEVAEIAVRRTTRTAPVGGVGGDGEGSDGGEGNDGGEDSDGDDSSDGGEDSDGGRAET